MPRAPLVVRRGARHALTEHGLLVGRERHPLLPRRHRARTNQQRVAVRVILAVVDPRRSPNRPRTDPRAYPERPVAVATVAEAISPPHVDNLLVSYAAAATAYCLAESGTLPFLLSGCA